MPQTTYKILLLTFTVFLLGSSIAFSQTKLKKESQSLFSDSIYTAMPPEGYQIPANRLDSALIVFEPENEIVEAVNIIPAYKLSFDTTSAVELEKIMDEVGYVPIVADALLKDRLSCLENEVPLVFHKRVKAFINYFAVKDREFTKRILQRKNIYFPIFERKLAEHGMPDELKYLSIIESALIPNAKSRAKAIGLWQFMAPTGRMFGLSSGYHIDERMDPEKATEAACKYLKYLHNMFGDWELAIASYNCGPGNIRKAKRRSGYKKTFWGIFDHLPRETRSYLPQLVAMIYVINYADEHNFVEEDLFYQTPSETVSISQFLDLGLLADELRICKEDLLLLNPELKRGAVPAGMKNYQLNIPENRLADFRANEDSILSRAGRESTYNQNASTGKVYSKSGKYYHVVRRGESLGVIAEKNKVGLSQLRSWNGISGNKIYPGQKLVVYTSSNKSTSTTSGKSTVSSKTRASSVTYHKVRSGEVLGSIANRYGISVSNLRKWNNISGDKINKGQSLRVKSPTARAGISSGQYHVVKSGEALSTIASKYGTSVTKIKAMNSLRSNNLRVGQKLLVENSKQKVIVPKNQNLTNGKYHVVSSGDNLSSIATKYGVGVSDIQRWNNLNGTRINSGQKLIVSGERVSNYSSKSSYYVVKSGDTLWDLAKRFNTTETKLKSDNGLKSSRLDIGQKLKVKF
ncbi:MAG: membrane-bound lytic murein transglycosylase D [Flammeovirgaceae bacterium]|jgi:membrane-bound lytic murein transglycosylase D